MTPEDYRQRLDVAKALSAGIKCSARAKADGLPWIPLTIEDTVGCWNPPVIFWSQYEVKVDEAHQVVRASV